MQQLLSFEDFQGRRLEKLETREINPDYFARNRVVIITQPKPKQSIVKGRITPQNWKIWAVFDLTAQERTSL